MSLYLLHSELEILLAQIPLANLNVSSSVGGFPPLRASTNIFLRLRLLRASKIAHQRAYSSSLIDEFGNGVGARGEQSSKSKSPRAITPEGVQRRIHILGVGSIGKLVAYNLAGIPNRPPISLLFHRQSTREAWEYNGQAIEIERHGETDRRTGFDAESSARPVNETQLQEQMRRSIHNLIVAVKAPRTVSALSSIAHRITPESTIVFLQNGMGILDEVNDTVFTDTDTRPNYMVGVVSHGVYNKSLFKAEHNGQGTLALSVLPKLPFDKVYTLDSESMLLPQSSRYMLRTLTRTPVLAAVAYPPQELFQLQLQKLVVNAVVNPLTAILGCYNGELLHNMHATRLMRMLLAEISLVIRSLPELQGQPNIETRFSSEKLEWDVINVLEQTARNRSSMLQDVRKSQETEISYINGWFVKKGEDLGFRCVVNYAVMQLLETKSWLTFQKETDVLPFEGTE